MTEPTQDSGRKTNVIPVGSRTIVIRELTDTQMLHMARHARILQDPNVDNSVKLESSNRMLTMLNSMVVQDSDREYVVEQQELGNLDLDNMTGWVRGFQTDDEKKPAVRRATKRAR